MYEESSLFELQVLGIIQAGHIELSDIKPSDWVEQNVVMGLPRQGPYRYSYTPYCKEIIDRLASNDPAKWIAVMKGLQIGISAGVIIPGMGYIIKEAPGNTYFTVGAPDLIDKSVEKLDLMIDNAGLRGYIKPQVVRNRANKSGDTNTKKDFSGGFINITTPNNHKEWRDVSLKYGFIDDFEAAKAASKESGNTRKLIEGRFAAYKDTHKIFYISTPERKETSNIEPAYLLGDQRKFLIPCPCCGEYIEIRWNMPDGVGVIWDEPMPEGTGVVWELDEDKHVIPESVGYVCQKCNGFFDDSNKQELLNKGYWQPTAKPSQAGFFSYHISSLYAPAGMYDWAHYVNFYMEANPVGQPRNESLHMTFMNTCLGVTYEGESTAPKANSIQKNIRPYEIGTIPEKQSIADGNGRIVLLTRGADMNGTIEGVNGAKANDARLDYEIVAWSENGASYSIRHGSIGTFIPRENTRKDKVDRERWTYEHNKPNSVWPEFEKQGQEVFKTDTGREMKISITGLDCGAYSIYAYMYLDKTNNYTIGLKGDKEDKYIRHQQDQRLFWESAERKGDNGMYMLKVGLFKDRLADYMQLKWSEGNGETQPSNFMNYPEPANGLYSFSNFFEHYEAEHRTQVMDKEGGSMFRWVKKNSAAQNHLFDCRIYNMALREIIVDKVGRELQIKGFKWADFVAATIGA